MTYLLILAASTIIFYIARHFFKGSKVPTNSNPIKNSKQIDTAIQLTPKQFAEKYKTNQGQVKGGTLCFWGRWFGRPYDNLHQITSVSYDTDLNILTILFSEQETLTVTNPSDIEEYRNRFQINQADKVYWQWYYYGKTQAEENLFYYDITKNGSTVNGLTNANWYKADWSDLTLTKPAVLLT